MLLVDRRDTVLFLAHLLYHPFYLTAICLYFIFRAAFDFLLHSLQTVQRITLRTLIIFFATVKTVYFILKRAFHFVFESLRITFFIATHLFEILAIFVPLFSFFNIYFSIHNLHRAFVYLSNPSRLLDVLAIALLLLLLTLINLVFQLLFRSKELAQRVFFWIYTLVRLAFLVLTIQITHRLVLNFLESVRDNLVSLDPRLYSLFEQPDF